MSLRRPLIGLALGVLAGAAWGWLGGAEDRADSVAGTAFLCGLAGLLAGALLARSGGRSGPPGR
nr:hypothetical protein [uncultured Actinoplanes sp.]